MPTPRASFRSDAVSGKSGNTDDSPWGFVIAASPSLFPDQTGSIETRAAQTRDERNRAAIRSVGRSGTVPTLRESLKSGKRDGFVTGSDVGRYTGTRNQEDASSSSSDDDDEKTTSTTRGRLVDMFARPPRRVSSATTLATVSAMGNGSHEAMPATQSTTQFAGSGVGTPGGATKAPRATTESSPMQYATPGVRNAMASGIANATRPGHGRSSLSTTRASNGIGSVATELGKRALMSKLDILQLRVEEPPIMMTPLQRKHMLRWHDKYKGRLRTVADVVLAAMKKARSDAVYLHAQRVENEKLRLARLEELRLKQADFKRSDPRVLWKKAFDAIRFSAYIKRLVGMTKKAKAAANVRKQKMDRLAAEAAAAEASGETVDKKTPEPLSPNDPISAKEMESQTIRASLEVTRRTLSSRFGDSGSLVSKNLSSRFGDSGGSFDHGASFASTRGDGGAGGDGQHSESRDSFVPKLGQQNAKLLATAGRHSTLSLSVSDYKELSLQLREEEAREAREREDNNKARVEFHWRPVIRVRMADTLPLELFLDNDDAYDIAVVNAGRTLRNAVFKESGAEADLKAAADAEADENAQFGEYAENSNEGASLTETGNGTRSQLGTLDGKKNTMGGTNNMGGTTKGQKMDDATALKIARERRRRAAILSRAYDANLARVDSNAYSRNRNRNGNGPAGSFPGGGPSVSGRVQVKDTLGWRGPSSGKVDGSKTLMGGKPKPNPTLGNKPRIMRFHKTDQKVEVKSFDHFLSDTFKKEGSNVDSQTKFLALMHEKKLRTQHYGKSYVPPASRSAVTYGARELRYREKEGGALAVEMKTLALREKEIKLKTQKSYAARLYKSWLDVRVIGKQSGENASGGAGTGRIAQKGIPQYMRDVEPAEDAREWWPGDAKDLSFKKMQAR